MTPLFRAAALAVAAAFLFNLETVLAKALGELPIPVLVLARAAGQLLWAVPSLFLLGRALLATEQLPMQIFRGFLSVASWGFYFLSFSRLPLATATVLNFTSVMFVTALAGPVLKEVVRWRRWGATIIGFLGVLAIVRPGALPGGLESAWPIGAAMTSAFIGAVIVLTTKFLARTERTETIMCYIGLVSFACALPFGLPLLDWPTPMQALLLLGLAIVGPFAMHLWITALRMADASVLAPISYVRLVFAVLSGVLLFGEGLDGWVGLGALLIVGSALYITHREARVAVLKPATAAAVPQGAVKGRSTGAPP